MVVRLLRAATRAWVTASTTTTPLGGEVSSSLTFRYCAVSLKTETTTFRSLRPLWVAANSNTHVCLGATRPHSRTASHTTLQLGLFGLQRRGFATGGSLFDKLAKKEPTDDNAKDTTGNSPLGEEGAGAGAFRLNCVLTATP